MKSKKRKHLELEFLGVPPCHKSFIFSGVEEANHHFAVEFKAFGFGVFKVFSGLFFNWGSR